MTETEYAYGKISENMLADQIYRKFGVFQCADKYSHFDYESDDTLVELKSRRVLSTAYPDYMMNGCKLYAAQKSGKTVYFVFRFTDGVFYWKYDASVPLRNDYNGRRDRGCDETQFMYYLPSALFKPIDEVADFILPNFTAKVRKVRKLI
jgi:hypothetical protein